MRKVLLGAAGVSMLMVAGQAMAAYNTPAKAKGLKLDLAVAYNTCLAPNDTSGSAPPLPACHPAVPTTNTNGTHKVSYGLKGAANLQVGVATGDIKIGVKSADIDDNGVLIADGQQLGLHLDHAVATTTNCASADPGGCSTQDLGLLFSNVFKAGCLKGKCTLKTTVNTVTPGQITAGAKVNITISGLGLSDQDGDLAFSEGLFIP